MILCLSLDNIFLKYITLFCYIQCIKILLNLVHSKRIALNRILIMIIKLKTQFINILPSEKYPLRILYRKKKFLNFRMRYYLKNRNTFQAYRFNIREGISDLPNEEP